MGARFSRLFTFKRNTDDDKKVKRGGSLNRHKPETDTRNAPERSATLPARARPGAKLEKPATVMQPVVEDDVQPEDTVKIQAAPPSIAAALPHPHADIAETKVEVQPSDSEKIDHEAHEEVMAQVVAPSVSATMPSAGFEVKVDDQQQKVPDDATIIPLGDAHISDIDYKPPAASLIDMDKPAGEVDRDEVMEKYEAAENALLIQQSNAMHVEEPFTSLNLSNEPPKLDDDISQQAQYSSTMHTEPDFDASVQHHTAIENSSSPIQYGSSQFVAPSEAHELVAKSSHVDSTNDDHEKEMQEEPAPEIEASASPVMLQPHLDEEAVIEPYMEVKEPACEVSSASSEVHEPSSSEEATIDQHLEVTEHHSEESAPEVEVVSLDMQEPSLNEEDIGEQHMEVEKQHEEHLGELETNVVDEHADQELAGETIEDSAEFDQDELEVHAKQLVDNSLDSASQKLEEEEQFVDDSIVPDHIPVDESAPAGEDEAGIEEAHEELVHEMNLSPGEDYSEQHQGQTKEVDESQLQPEMISDLYHISEAAPDHHDAEEDLTAEDIFEGKNVHTQQFHAPEESHESVVEEFGGDSQEATHDTELEHEVFHESDDNKPSEDDEQSHEGEDLTCEDIFEGKDVHTQQFHAPEESHEPVVEEFGGDSQEATLDTELEHEVFHESDDNKPLEDDEQSHEGEDLTAEDIFEGKDVHLQQLHAPEESHKPVVEEFGSDSQEATLDTEPEHEELHESADTKPSEDDEQSHEGEDDLVAEQHQIEHEAVDHNGLENGEQQQQSFGFSDSVTESTSDPNSADGPAESSIDKSPSFDADQDQIKGSPVPPYEEPHQQEFGDAPADHHDQH